MPFTYQVSDAVNTLSTLAKGIPLSALAVPAADMASMEMYRAYPWRWTVMQIGSGVLPLSDGVQDYNAPTQIYRLLRARIVRTDVTPNDYRDLDIQDDLVPDLTIVSYTAIRCISHQESAGQLRLESAVSVTGTMTLEIQGEYQVAPPKITSQNQGLWFPDNYQDVFVRGMLYWVYKLADDPRAGTVGTNATGVKQYTGAYGEFMESMRQMKEAEDYGADEQMFPERSLGEGKFTGNLSIYGV